MAAVAVSLAVAVTGCKEKEKTPTEIQDAEVVSTIAPGDTVDQVEGAVVEMQEGDTEAVGVGEAVSQQVVASDGSVAPAPESK